MPGNTREITLWVPPNQRPEAVAEQARKEAAHAKALAAKDAEVEARLAVAQARERHARIMTTGQELVLTQLEKLLRLARNPDFADTPGPFEMKDLIKLADLVSKDHRLSTGQATEHIAHVVGPSVDFSKLTQEERDEWRRLAMKGGGGEDE